MGGAAPSPPPLSSPGLGAPPPPAEQQAQNLNTNGLSGVFGWSGERPATSRGTMAAKHTPAAPTPPSPGGAALITSPARRPHHLHAPAHPTPCPPPRAAGNVLGCSQLFRFSWFVAAFLFVTLLGLLVCAAAKHAMGTALHFTRPFWVSCCGCRHLLLPPLNASSLARAAAAVVACSLQQA